MTQERLRVVVDPAWKKVDREGYTTAWQQLVAEAASCAFAGVDLEWTSRRLPARDEEEEDGEQKNRRNKNDDGGRTVESTEDEKRTTAKRPAHFVGPVAVVQLSTFSVTVVIKLCDVVSMTGDVSCAPPEREVGDTLLLEVVRENLRSLLADGRVVKVGVGILGDQAKLQRDYANLRMTPCVDLAALSRRLLLASCAEVEHLRSLKDLAARFAGKTLEKDTLVTRSDWGGSLGALSPLQVEYAAADAEASFDVCVGILVESGLVDSGEALHAACGTQDEPSPVIVSVLQAAVGLKPSSRPKCSAEKPVDGHNTAGWCRGRVKPYYDNIFVYDADMNLVFTVDKSKAEWYVYKKGLAKVTEWREVVSDDGPTLTPSSSNEHPAQARKEIAAIRLCFKPDFSKYTDAHIRRNLDYFRKPKENQCVVCGKASELVRFAIVPLAYRRYFPSVYMSHNSYDLLLLCTACFAVARMLYDDERQRIAADFSVPLTHLTHAEIKVCRAQLQQQMMDTNEKNNSSSSSSSATEEMVTHGADGCLSPTQKLRVFQTYLEIEEHREILLGVFKYAKALRASYAESSAKQEASERAEQQNTLEEGGTARTTRIARVRVKPTLIPEARVKQLSEYIATHAPRYPFARCAAEQAALFSANAASPASVRCILDEGVSPRTVLTRFWFRKHPEVRRLFACTTRKSGCHRGDDVSSGAWDNGGVGEGEEEEDTLSVDSHGFLVVQALLQKYDGHPHKSRDHALGEFIYRWRTVFLQGMRPTHLPDSWRADDGLLL